MEIFYSDYIANGQLALTQEDSVHCARVLRHKAGDLIHVVDGMGTMYDARICSDNPKKVLAGIEQTYPQWHSHPYRLTMAVCPTKNNERFEWFIEKAVEIGVDRIVPLIGQRSERKVYKTDRARKIVISAAKQSLKAEFPMVSEPVTVMDFLNDFGKGGNDECGLGLIAWCFEEESSPRLGIDAVLAGSDARDITILIGPEGDFSREEALKAIEMGFRPIHLGDSRLRTETAAVVATALVYGSRMSSVK